MTIFRILFLLKYDVIKISMSSIHKLKDQSLSEDINLDDQNKGSVKLTDLLSRLKEEKKKERNSNIALSVAAVSAVTVFGIILSL